MPFEGTFRDFEEGDLVYGVEDDRERYFKPSAFKAKRTASTLHTIDQHATLKTEVQKKGKLSATEEAFNATLLAHPKYKDAVLGEETNATVRHKAKGGLYWATLVQGKHVHFVLDTVDLEKVIKKSFDPDVQKYIQFWFNREKCGPPWVSYAKYNPETDKCAWSTKDEAAGLWSQYKPKTVYVHKESAAS